MLTEMEVILEHQKETIIGACNLMRIMVEDDTTYEAVLGRVNTIINTMTRVKSALENVDEYLRFKELVYGDD